MFLIYKLNTYLFMTYFFLRILLNLLQVLSIAIKVVYMLKNANYNLN